MEYQQNRHAQPKKKVVYLNNHLPKHKMAQRLNTPPKPSSAFSLRKAMILGIGLLSIGLASIPLIQTLNESKGVKEEYQASQRLEEELLKENIAVQEEYQHMQDPDYLADVARRDYFYSKPGEIIFDLEDSY